MIKYLLIDVDNTLLDFDKCAYKAMKAACLDCGIAFSEDLPRVFHTVNDAFWLKIERGEMLRSRLYAIRFNIVFGKLGVDYDGVAFEKAFRLHLDKSAEKTDGAKETLSYLSEKYVLCVASNASHDQQKARLTLAGLSEYFTHYFVSASIGADKPHAEFFDKCFSALKNPDKSEVALIGDSLTADISGGKNYGITTVWFNRKKDKTPPFVIPDFTVENLVDIKDIL